MKLKILLLLSLLSLSLYAQAPKKMSYQAVIRNTSGTLVASTAVGLKISILKGSVSGAAVYEEIHTANTNANGLVSIEIGTGNNVSGDFGQINWGNDSYFIKTETDPTGDTNYTIFGTSQLLSVPYALYADNTKNLGKSTIYLRDNITDAEAAEKLSRFLGPNTENIYIQNTTALTTVDLSAATSLLKLRIENNANLTTVIADYITEIDDELIVGTNPNLTTVSLSALSVAEDIQLYINDQLSNLNLVNLTKIGKNIGISNSSLTQLNLPALVTCGGTINIDGNALTSVNISSLTTVDVIRFSGCPSLPSLSLGALTTIANDNNYGDSFSIYQTGISSLNIPALTSARMRIEFNPQLTSLSFSSMNTGNIIVHDSPNLSSTNFPAFTNGYVEITDSSLQQLNFPSLTNGSFLVTGNLQLASVSFPNLNTTGDLFRFNNNSLPSAQVNDILHQMLTVAPPNYKTIYLQSQNPSAPPTGQGITDKATLISNANTVLTD